MASTDAEAVLPATDESDEQRPVRSHFTQQPPAEEAPAPAAAPVAMPPEQPAPVAAPVVAAPAPTVAAAPAPGMPKVAPYALSLDDLRNVAQASGLEWVNSDAARVAEVQAAIAAEPKPIHVPREPKPVVLVDEGPLVLVETRKDLRDVSLPFESR